jgi:hypothetical protein
MNPALGRYLSSNYFISTSLTHGPTKRRAGCAVVGVVVSPGLVAPCSDQREPTYASAAALASVRNIVVCLPGVRQESCFEKSDSRWLRYRRSSLIGSRSERRVLSSQSWFPSVDHWSILLTGNLHSFSDRYGPVSTLSGAFFHTATLARAGRPLDGVVIVHSCCDWEDVVGVSTIRGGYCWPCRSIGGGGV